MVARKQKSRKRRRLLNAERETGQLTISLLEKLLRSAKLFPLSPCFFSAFPVKKVHLPGFYYSRISAAVALFPKNSEARFRSASKGKAFLPIAHIKSDVGDYHRSNSS